MSPPRSIPTLRPSRQTERLRTRPSSTTSRAAEIDPASIDRLEELVDETAGPGLETIAGGSVIQEMPETGTSELIGVAAAIVILLVAFGSLVAMGLPIITAIAGVGISMLLTIVMANVINFSSITTALVSMMGLGVGIDYALFIINRFREEHHELGSSIDDSIVRATDTAGRAVLFAGSLVIVALLGLFVIGIPFIGLLGLGGAIAVLVSMLVGVGPHAAAAEAAWPLARTLDHSQERAQARRSDVWLAEHRAHSEASGALACGWPAAGRGTGLAGTLGRAARHGRCWHRSSWLRFPRCLRSDC